MKIKPKFILTFVAVSLTSLTITNILFFTFEKKNKTREIINHLESVASIQHSRIRAIINQNMERLSLVASRTQLRISLDEFNRNSDKDHQNKMNRILDDAKKSIRDFNNISIYTLDGIVAASTDREKIGSHDSNGEIFISGKQKKRVDQFSLNQNQKPIVFLSGPLLLEDKLLGVVIIESTVDNIASSINDYTGLGKTGESILARRNEFGDAVFIMPTRFDDRAALKLNVSKEKKDVPLMRSFTEKELVLSDSVDHRAIPVLAVTRHIEETDWGLVVKIDKSEAFAPLTKMRDVLIFILVFSSILLILISIYLSGTITRPIIRLTKAARKISKGDLSVKADESSGDEIGVLGLAFNVMTTNLIDTNNKIEAKVQELRAEINERHQAEEALRSSELKYRNLFNSILYGYAIHEIILDKETNEPIDYRFLEINPAFNDHTNIEAITGLKIKDIIGKTVLEILPETEEYWIKEYGKVALTGKQIEFDAPADSLGKHYQVFAFQNQPGQFAVIFSDITKQKQAEEQIKASLKEKETLLQEIHHRVKNNMTVISSLLKLQSYSMEDERLKAALIDSQNRVESMSLVHETLYQSESLSSINLKTYLSKLAQIVAQNYSTGSKVNLKIEAENIIIGIKQASPLGLIVNELITNSFKYAFPNFQKGEIKISLQKIENQIELTYQDNGIGIPADFEWYKTKSMGLNLVRLLAENQLDGSIDMERKKGTTFIIKFNIDAA